VLLSGGLALIHFINMRMLAAYPGAKSKVAGLYNLASMTGSTFGAIAGGMIADVLPLPSVFLAWLPVLALGAGAVGLVRHRRLRTGALSPEVH